MGKKQHLHEKRGISFAELGALLGTRALLEMQGEFAKASPKREQKCCVMPGVHRLDMGETMRQYGCGTVGCIGGHMAVILGETDGPAHVPHTRDEKAHRYVMVKNSNGTPLHNLFFPPFQHDKWYRITPKIAVQAIDNWLKYGDPKWRKLLPNVPVRAGA